MKQRLQELVGPFGVALSIGLISILDAQHGVARVLLAMVAGLALGLGMRRMLMEARRQGPR